MNTVGSAEDPSLGNLPLHFLLRPRGLDHHGIRLPKPPGLVACLPLPPPACRKQLQGVQRSEKSIQGDNRGATRVTQHRGIRGFGRPAMHKIWRDRGDLAEKAATGHTVVEQGIDRNRKRRQFDEPVPPAQILPPRARTPNQADPSDLEIFPLQKGVRT
jgi:hypothetical protein